LVEQQGFRRDLYARLAFFELRLPPLRRRRQDILPWLMRFASDLGRARGLTPSLTFLPDAVERILLHAWPDNLRGLNRLAHRVAEHADAVGLRALCEAMPELVAAATDVHSTDPPQPPNPAAGQSSAPTRATPTQPSPSREELLAAYDSNDRSVRAAAKHFGKDRRQVYRWLERYGIARDGEHD